MSCLIQYSIYFILFLGAIVQSQRNSGSDVGCHFFDFRNLTEINRHIPNLQKFPVSIDLSHGAGELVVLLRIIAIVHYSCHIAGFQARKLCIDFRNGILGKNTPWRGDFLPFPKY